MELLIVLDNTNKCKKTYNCMYQKNKDVKIYNMSEIFKETLGITKSEKLETILMDLLENNVEKIVEHASLMLKEKEEDIEKAKIIEESKKQELFQEISKKFTQIQNLYLKKIKKNYTII